MTMQQKLARNEILSHSPWGNFGKEKEEELQSEVKIIGVIPNTIEDIKEESED